MKAKKVESAPSRPILLATEILEKVRNHKKKTGVEMKFFVEQAVIEKLKRDDK